jgi:hypothetical protein
MKFLNKIALGMIASVVSATSSAAPIVLEWVQTGFGTGTYLNSVGNPVTVSGDGVANGGRIVLSDSSLLSQNFSYSVSTRFSIPVAISPPISEVSFNSASTTNGRIRNFTFGIPEAGLPSSASASFSCPYLVVTPPSGGVVGQDDYCQASVDLVRDVSQPNRYYGIVSTGYGSLTRPDAIANDFIVNSGNPLQLGSGSYFLPVGGGFTRVQVPISGYWQQVLPPTNVPLPSALLLLLTGLGLFAVKRRSLGV